MERCANVESIMLYERVVNHLSLLIFLFVLLLISGDYLGEKNDFNEQVLKAFVDLHDFSNLILVQALR